MILRTRLSHHPKKYALVVGFCIIVAQQKASWSVAASSATVEQRSPEHTMWSKGGIDEIYYWLNCPDQQASEDALTVPDMSVWRLLHETYQSVLPSSKALPPLDHDQLTSGYPVEVKLTSYRGEIDIGIVATRSISKGTLVWNSTSHTAQFDSGTSFRTLAQALPVKLACDVLDWAFPRYVDKEPVVCVDLYHGSLIGICDDEEECNLILSREGNDNSVPSSGCGMEFYASRDIVAGELLLMDHFPQDAEALVPLGLAHGDGRHADDGEQQNGIDKIRDEL